MAINTVKMWVPNTQPMVGIIQEFALQMLRKLQTAPHSRVDGTKSLNGNGSATSGQDEQGQQSDSTTPPDHVEESKMDQDGPPKEPSQEPGTPPENEQSSAESEALVRTPYLPDRVDLPADKQQVLQHVELPFALSVKVPELLEAFVFFFSTSVQVLPSDMEFQGYSWPLVRWTSVSRNKSRT